MLNKRKKRAQKLKVTSIKENLLRRIHLTCRFRRHTLHSVTFCGTNKSNIHYSIHVGFANSKPTYHKLLHNMACTRSRFVLNTSIKLVFFEVIVTASPMSLTRLPQHDVCEKPWLSMVVEGSFTPFMRSAVFRRAFTSSFLSCVISQCKDSGMVLQKMMNNTWIMYPSFKIVFSAAVNQLFNLQCSLHWHNVVEC